MKHFRKPESVGTIHGLVSAVSELVSRVMMKGSVRITDQALVRRKLKIGIGMWGGDFSLGR